MVSIVSNRVRLLAIAAAVCALAACALAGCASSSQSSASSGSSASSSVASSSTAVVGGWQVSSDVTPVLSAEDKALYDSAEGADPSVEPVALLATQVVSGLNYAFLGKDASGWNVLVCYKSLDGKTLLTSSKVIEIDNVKTAEKTVPDGVVGGWTVQAPESAAALSQDDQAVFDKAMEGYDGVSLVPIALLGTQVVAGTNYLFLCAGKDTAQESASELYVVTVYEDPQGNAQITSVEPFDLLYYIGN